MIEPVRHLFRILPVALVLIGVMQIVFGVVEIRLTGEGVALSALGTGLLETRWLTGAAYVRAASDGIWTISFAAVVAAAAQYLDREADD